MKTLFTGFQPFGKHTFNPSLVVAKEAARVSRAAVEILSVDFESAREAGRASAAFDVVVHVGLAAATPWVRLERFAHNLRMAVDDPSQEHDPDAVIPLDPDGPLALDTVLPVDTLRKCLLGAWDVRHSRDAGTYVCNATYYWSLKFAPETRVIFVHVPAWESESGRRFGQALGACFASRTGSLLADCRSPAGA